MDDNNEGIKKIKNLTIEKAYMSEDEKEITIEFTNGKRLVIEAHTNVNIDRYDYYHGIWLTVDLFSS